MTPQEFKHFIWVVGLVFVIATICTTIMYVSSHPWIFRIEMDDNTRIAIQSMNWTAIQSQQCPTYTSLAPYNGSMWKPNPNYFYTSYVNQTNITTLFIVPYRNGDESCNTDYNKGQTCCTKIVDADKQIAETSCVQEGTIRT